jgi:hypothetical protein
LTYLFKSHAREDKSVATTKPAPESKPAAEDKSAAAAKPAPESKPAAEDKPHARKLPTYRTKCVIQLNKAGHEEDPELHEFKNVIGTSVSGLWTASCFGFQPKVRVTATISGTMSEAGSDKGFSVAAVIPGSNPSAYFGGNIGESGYAEYSQPFSGYANDQGEVLVQFGVGMPEGASITAGPGSKIEITAHPTRSTSSTTNTQKSGDGGQCANLVASGNGSIDCSATQQGKDNAPKNPQKQ